MLILSIILIVALAAEDQLIKLYIVNNFAECRGAVRVYKNFKIGDFDFVGITHIRNDGAAWSTFGGQTLFLTVFSLIAFLAILGYIFYRRKNIGRVELFSLSLIAAGGLGNLIDRARMLIEGTDVFRGVIDYIKLQFIDFPVFNFADCCVTVGGVLFCAVVLFGEVKAAKERKRQPNAEESDEQV